MRTSFANLLLDLDGTLVDSKAAMLECLRGALVANGLGRLADEVVPDVIGPPAIDIVRRLDPDLPDGLAARVVVDFRRAYDADPMRGLTVYDGVPEALERLSASGARLFLVTNKPAVPARRIVDALGWRCLGRPECPDSVPGGRPRAKSESVRGLIDGLGLEPEATLMVGDTLGDVRAAHAAGIRAAGVAWGYPSDKAPVRAEADLWLRSPSDLPGLCPGRGDAVLR